MKSKFSTDKYKEWLSNFLALKMNCVFFTDDRTKKWLDTWINVSNDAKIRFVILEMDKFITAKYDWSKQLEMDDEKNYHSRELYMIWNEKINFLKLSSEINPFQTDWFLWCDAGSLRQKIFIDDDFTKSDVIPDLENDKTYFFRVPCLYHNNYFLKNLEQYKCNNTDLRMIQGGFILTNLKSCRWIHQEYYDLLDRLYEKNLFIGKDQCCYLSLVLQSQYAKVLQITKHKLIHQFSDVWFFVFPFILGLSNYSQISYFIQ
jgi:hypothetical protein